jgi:hypothetical protein
MATRGCTSRAASSEPQVFRVPCTVIRGTPALMMQRSKLDQVPGEPEHLSLAQTHDEDQYECCVQCLAAAAGGAVRLLHDPGPRYRSGNHPVHPPSLRARHPMVGRVCSRLHNLFHGLCNIGTSPADAPSRGISPGNPLEVSTLPGDCQVTYLNALLDVQARQSDGRAFLRAATDLGVQLRS